MNHNSNHPGNWRTVHISLLPFIEQQAAYDGLLKTRMEVHGVDWQVRDTIIKYVPGWNKPWSGISSYLCPSDALSPAYHPSGNCYFPKGNYLAMTGPLEGQMAVEIGAFTPGWSAPFQKYMGAFCFTKFRSMASLLDGTSNTIVYSEYLRGEKEQRYYGTLTDDRPSASFMNWKYGPNSPIADGMISDANYCTSTNGLEGNGNSMPNLNMPCVAVNASQVGYRSFCVARSRHSGGVNALRGDGSVAFYSDTTAIGVWADLCAIANSDQGDLTPADVF